MVFAINFATFKNPIFNTHFYVRVWLLLWLLSPSFDSPFSPPGQLYLLPPSSLLYPSESFGAFCSVENASGIDCWLDCSLSFWLPLFSSWSPLSTSSLFSSPCNSETLWVSLTVENFSTINLDVLSSVLYGWISLETIVRIILKARGRRLKSKTWELQKTPDWNINQ